MKDKIVELNNRSNDLERRLMSSILGENHE